MHFPAQRFTLHVVPGTQRKLFDFAKVATMQPLQSTTATVSLSVDNLVQFDSTGNRLSLPGDYEVILSTGNRTREIVLPLRLDGEVRILESLPHGL
eukprot:m.426992 g.426992  ORF g.426992 m.426992 type:complete len:96 (-) comp21361_c0_seq6:248-535(-)